MVITRNAYDELENEAKKHYPCEACGMLLGNTDGDIITEIKTIKNSVEADRADKHFFMDPPAVYEAEKEAKEKGLEVLGFYHTHPDHEAVLSKKDKEYMIPGVLYMVVSVTDKGCRDVRLYKNEPE